MADQVISPQWSLYRNLPPFRTILTGVVLVFLAWIFFTKRSLQFYASVLFLFYGLTHSMWISVICLGVFQTLLLIPFRITNIIKSQHIKDFEAVVAEQNNASDQSFLIKKQTKSGNRVILYYLVNFAVDLTSYISIGRLFLTDFYSVKLDPWLLYSFVPYPHYPIQDVWFKIPYLAFHQTRDLGWGTVLLCWLAMLVVTVVATLIHQFLVKHKVKIKAPVTAFITGSTLLLMVAAYFLIRNFPTQVGIAILTADVGRPFPTLNTITAVATFFTLLWLDIPSILKKGDLAAEAKIDPAIIQKTQSRLFGDSLRSATIVGLGAYFITNKIPCAFELSIFTLEIISWLSPLTLDRMILKSKSKLTMA